MPDYVEYQRSIANELIAVKDRVRNIIGDANWSEEGRYKETILREIISDKLPSFASCGTGFAVSNHQISSQIDIMVYDNTMPLLFSKGDFVIVPADAVLGIIEIKSNLYNVRISDVIKKAHKNGELIGKEIFNGIFSFTYESRQNIIDNTPICLNMFSTAIKDSLTNYSRRINNIVLDNNYFIKYWSDGQPHSEPDDKYKLYNIQNLAFGYFISIFFEDVYIQKYGRAIPNTIASMLYPIEGTKEAYCIDRLILN